MKKLQNGSSIRSGWTVGLLACLITVGLHPLSFAQEKKASPAGDSEKVEFWVINVGPRIPEDSRSRIFERFGRIDNGRGIKGSGLGLAIVTAIAAAHGGVVTLISSDAQTRFGIRIPRIAVVPRPGNIGEQQ